MKKAMSVCLLFVLLFSLFLPVSAAAADTHKAGMVVTAEGPLNVRNQPSTSGRVLTMLPRNSYVTLVSQEGSWWKVAYRKGYYGYCHADYIRVISATTAHVNAPSGLNVRTGAGTSYRRLAILPKGEQVLVLSTSGGWSKVLYHGNQTGYVSAQYLTGQSSTSKITLNVPDFKQTDPRWAQTPIGNSTMAKIGCATTAIAMMESCRTGSTIYPDAMAKKLKYTSSGSVYWPADYVSVADKNGYLQAIYQQLKQGKPVLLGAKNTSGKQHWVVVYGFAGGSVSDTSQFLIRDPGATSRTTLKHLLNQYPNFYKFFYHK